MIDDQLSKTSTHCFLNQTRITKIKTTLLYENVYKTADNYISKTCTLGTIAYYPTSCVHTYTDSSVSYGTKTAGFGVYLSSRMAKLLITLMSVRRPVLTFKNNSML